MGHSTAESTERRPGVVSVVLVNYRGAEDTIVCLRSLAEVDWPVDRLELIVVDNASGDGSAERISREVPGVTVLDAGANLGFAGGCNLGVRHSTGEYVAFINNDARPDEGWVRAAVEVLEADRDVASVASKVLDWDGRTIDYVDGSLTWFGMGYKREVGAPVSDRWDVPRDVLFGTGAAMFVRADVYERVGGFDERFFMFYEDVDLGWRLNLLGHRVRYVPGSVAFHRHHVTMNKFGSYRESYLLERNALMSMYKNLGDEALHRALPAAMALAVRRSFARTDLDPDQLDLQRSPGGDDVPDVTIPKMALTGPLALDHFVEQLPTLARSRRELQADRRRGDRELLPLFREAMEPAYPHPRYVAGYQAVVDAFGIAEVFSSRHRILVITGEPLLSTMAGPAIRAWEIARRLAPEHDVRLVSTVGAETSHPDFRVEYAGGTGLKEPTGWADVIIFQGFVMEQAPWLARSSKILVADVYDPMHLEQLEQGRDLGPVGRADAVMETTRVLNRQLRRADLVLCASDKQRDFWLGQLAGQGRVNPATYDEDNALGSLLRVVPFGLPDEPPVQRTHGVRGVVPGIGADDKVVIWGGGIYNWFDPVTLIRAVDRLRRRRPDVRLYFMGLKHPNPGVPAMRVAVEARQVAEELGLLGTHVFFNEGWVPYDQRADHLLDADVGVSTHHDHVETAFSFRTRILDYLWASLPVVTTTGDTFGTLIERHGLGRTVPPGDVAALEAALEEMLYDDAAAAAARAAVQAYAQKLRWSEVLSPVVEFCRFPRRAADLVGALPDAGLALRRSSTQPTGVRADLALVGRYLREGGVPELARRVQGRLSKRGQQSEFDDDDA